MCLSKRRRRQPTTAHHPDEGFLERLSDPSGDLAREWDRQHDKHIVEQLLATVQPDFSATTWDAVRRLSVDNGPA
jgi:hypothetical protein